MGFFTTSELPAGSVALHERPYATALMPQTFPHTCRACFGAIAGSRAKGLQTCRRCRLAPYCCYRCLKADRAGHSESGECWLAARLASLEWVAAALTAWPCLLPAAAMSRRACCALPCQPRYYAESAQPSTSRRKPGRSRHAQRHLLAHMHI